MGVLGLRGLVRIEGREGHEGDTPAVSHPIGISKLLVGMLLLGYPADLLGMYPLGNRWSLHLSPILLAALALGLNKVWRHSAGLGLAASLSVLSIFVAFLPQMDARNPLLSLPREGTREVVWTLEQEMEPGDRVFVWHAIQPAFDYYAAALEGDFFRGRHPDEAPIDEMVARILTGGPAGAAGTATDRWLVLGRISDSEVKELGEALGDRGWSMDWVSRVEGSSLARLVPLHLHPF
jgi:hypothetical protein